LRRLTRTRSPNGLIFMGKQNPPYADFENRLSWLAMRIQLKARRG
jgi:hypothetical protein